MTRQIPQTDRWTIGSSELEMYLDKDRNYTPLESDAMIYQTSFEASQKMHELQKNTPYELEVLDLDPTPTYNLMVAFNEY